MAARLRLGSRSLSARVLRAASLGTCLLFSKLRIAQGSVNWDEGLGGRAASRPARSEHHYGVARLEVAARHRVAVPRPVLRSPLVRMKCVEHVPVLEPRYAERRLWSRYTPFTSIRTLTPATLW